PRRETGSRRRAARTGRRCRPATRPPPRMAGQWLGAGAYSALLHHDRDRGCCRGDVTRVGAVVERGRLAGELLGLVHELGMVFDETRAQLAGAEVSALEDGAVVADRRRR